LKLGKSLDRFQLHGFPIGRTHSFFLVLKSPEECTESIQRLQVPSRTDRYKAFLLTDENMKEAIDFIRGDVQDYSSLLISKIYKKEVLLNVFEVKEFGGNVFRLFRKKTAGENGGMLLFSYDYHGAVKTKQHWNVLKVPHIKMTSNIVRVASSSTMYVFSCVQYSSTVLEYLLLCL
jgi:hypothetical protein